MSKTIELGSGEESVRVGDTIYVLRPTLGAAISINRAFGGFQPAMDRARAFDLVAITTVIAAGSGATDPAAIERLTGEIFVAGIARYAPQVIAYLGALATGGRISAAAEGESGGADPGNG